MKTIAILLVVMALGFNLLAQPTAITWQGKLLDASGNAITQNSVAMTFAMFDASTGGNQLWPISGGVTKAVDVEQGLYSVQLGTGTGDDIAFTAAMFNGKTPWLEVKVGAETLPRTEITNVPFALISNNLSASGWESPGEIGKTTPNTGKYTAMETGSLKVTTGASTGKVLTSDAGGNATWQNTKLANFEESNFALFPHIGVKLQAVYDFPDVDVVISPKGIGGILADQPDGTSEGGNNRGLRAVDLQMGRFNATKVASGSYAIIPGGFDNIASGSNSVAIGTSNYATGQSSVSLGSGNTASRDLAIAIGGATVASGYSSKTLGDFIEAPSAYETVLGRYNTTYTPASTTGWDPGDRLFIVANGTSNVARSNALTILKNANTTIGGSLTINGNGTNTSISFPTGRGSSGQVLTSNGSGGVIWATGGTVTGVTGTLPIVSSGGTAPEISINPATTSTAGSMSAADKAKLDGLKTHTIGESYGGGIVFYVYDGGYHGLIAATADIGAGTNYYWWNGVYKITGTSGDGLNAGDMNTTLIIASQMADNQIGYFAARVCANYSVTVDGITYGDWYLPSKYELNLLFLQKNTVGGFASNASYWSSSEDTSEYAWSQWFGSLGQQSSTPKNNTFRIRAIRAF